MADLSMYDSKEGGNFQNSANDLVLVNSLWAQPYLALFGGNYEQETPANEADLDNSIERFDWWGNSIAFPDEPDQQFNSQTERVLDNITLSNQGIEEVRKAVLQDLDYLQEIADIEVEVTIVNTNKIKIAIRLIEPTSLTDRNFVFLWDGTRVEEIVDASDLVKLPKPKWILESGFWSDKGVWDDSATWND